MTFFLKRNDVSFQEHKVSYMFKYKTRRDRFSNWTCERHVEIEFKGGPTGEGFNKNTLIKDDQVVGALERINMLIDET